MIAGMPRPVASRYRRELVGSIYFLFPILCLVSFIFFFDFTVVVLIIFPFYSGLVRFGLGVMDQIDHIAAMSNQ